MNTRRQDFWEFTSREAVEVIRPVGLIYLLAVVNGLVGGMYSPYDIVIHIITLIEVIFIGAVFIFCLIGYKKFK